MPLSILVGVLNTGKTFPFGLCFITSETTASFEFMLVLERILLLCIWDLFLHLLQAEPQSYRSLDHLQEIPA